MMWSDKAFAIYMGHAGEEPRGYVQEDTPVSVRSFDDTQVLALARHDVVAAELERNPAGQARDCAPERLAA